MINSGSSLQEPPLSYLMFITKVSAGQDGYDSHFCPLILFFIKISVCNTPIYHRSHLHLINTTEGCEFFFVSTSPDA